MEKSGRETDEYQLSGKPWMGNAGWRAWYQVDNMQSCRWWGKLLVNMAKTPTILEVLPLHWKVAL